MAGGRRRRTRAPKKSYKTYRTYSTQSTVKQVVNQMLTKKFLDTTQLGISTSTTGIVHHLSAIPQGDGPSARDGEFVTPLSLQWKIQFQSGDANNRMRFMIVKDLYSPGSNPTLANILEDDAATVNILSMANNTNKRRFKIMHDESFSLNPNITSGLYFITKSGFMKLPAAKVGFADSATTPRSNAYFMVCISDSGAVTHPTVGYYFRLRYSDA